MPRPNESNRYNRAGQSLQLKVMSAVPTIRYNPGAVVLVSNSTGTMLAINTTGTTWSYINKTSVLA